jgi:hypothetical protein
MGKTREELHHKKRGEREGEARDERGEKNGVANASAECCWITEYQKKTSFL